MMNKPWRLLLLLCICNLGVTLFASAQGRRNLKDTVVIPFEYKQSALYQGFTTTIIDSVVNILLKNDSVTLSIDGYAHQDEGNDTITKYLSLNRALFIKTYVLGRGIDSSRILSVTAYGKTRQLYRGTKNLGLGNCRAVMKINYPPPKLLEKDIDGDNISDSLDTCPEVYGEYENAGCPDTAAIIVPFDLQQTSLHALTYKVLDSVVRILKENPTYTLIIEGHASETEGSTGLCDRIAAERAAIVRQYLASRYIAVARIDEIKIISFYKPITAGRNSREISRNCRAQIYLNRHL